MILTSFPHLFTSWPLDFFEFLASLLFPCLTSVEDVEVKFKWSKYAEVRKDRSQNTQEVKIKRCKTLRFQNRGKKITYNLSLSSPWRSLLVMLHVKCYRFDRLNMCVIARLFIKCSRLCVLLQSEQLLSSPWPPLVILDGSHCPEKERPFWK